MNSSNPARDRPLLLHVFGSFEPGGAELRTSQLIDRDASFRHTIVALDGHVGAAQWLQRTDVTLLDQFHQRSSFANWFLLRRLVRELAPVAVLTYGWGAFDGVVASLLAGTPCVHHEDGLSEQEWNRPARRRVWARRWTLPRIARVIVPSRQLQECSVNDWRVPPKQVAWIPNGVEAHVVSKSDCANARAQLGINPGVLVVCVIGRLSKEKDVALALEAFARISSTAELHIAGDGPERERLLIEAERLGIAERTHFIGWMKETQTLLAAADVYLLSSATEQHPLALLEAMAAHLPVVATDVGDVRASLPAAQHTFVVPRTGESADDLARGLDGLLSDPKLRAELGEGNRLHIDREFLAGDMAARHYKVWADLAGSTSD